MSTVGMAGWLASFRVSNTTEVYLSTVGPDGCHFQGIKRHRTSSIHSGPCWISVSNNPHIGHGWLLAVNFRTARHVWVFFHVCSFSKIRNYAGHGWLSVSNNHRRHGWLSFSNNQCCRSGSNAFLTPGSGTRNWFFSGSRILNPHF
jgi:hypothetical protein